MMRTISRVSARLSAAASAACRCLMAVVLAAVVLSPSAVTAAQLPPWYVPPATITPVYTYMVCAVWEWRELQRRPSETARRNLAGYLKAVLAYDDWSGRKALPPAARKAMEEVIK